MTTTEELVRELGTLTDAPTPPMSVETSRIVVAGRRRRRRAVAARTVGALGIVALAGVGVARLAGPTGGADVAPPAGEAPAAQVTVVAGLEVAAATGTVPLGADIGEVHDAGLPLADGLRLVLEGDATRVRVRMADAATGDVGEPRLTLVLDPAVRRNPALAATDALSSTGLAVVVGVVEEGAEPALHVAGREEPVPLPTFTIDGVGDGARLFLAVVTGAPQVGAWPDLSVSTGFAVHRPLPVGTRAGTDEVPVGEPAPDTPEVRAATDPQVVDSSAGPALDLGVPVLSPLARPGPDGGLEELTYAVVTVELDATGAVVPVTEGATELTLAARTTRGALTPITVVPLDALRPATPTAAPFGAWISGGTDLEVLGILPAGAREARLVVPTPDGPRTTALPSFQVPGLPDAFFFAAVHAPTGQADLSAAEIEVVGADGTLTRWSAAGERLG